MSTGWRPATARAVWRENMGSPSSVADAVVPGPTRDREAADVPGGLVGADVARRGDVDPVRAVPGAGAAGVAAASVAAGIADPVAGVRMRAIAELQVQAVADHERVAGAGSCPRTALRADGSSGLACT